MAVFVKCANKPIADVSVILPIFSSNENEARKRKKVISAPGLHSRLARKEGLKTPKHTF